MSEHAKNIRRFIVDRFLFGDSGPLGDEDSLIDAGIVDSSGILELVGHLEERYGIKVEDEELVPENLDTISNIASFLEKKVAQVSGGGA